MNNMDIFTYTSLRDPDGAYALLREHSRIRVADQSELAHNLKQVYRNLRNEEKEDFLIKLANIHPDRKLLSETQKPSESDRPNNDMNCNCPFCHYHRMNNQVMYSDVIGTHVGANGLSAVGHFMNSGAVPPNMQTPNTNETNDVNSLKNESMFKKMLNDQIFKIVIVGAIGFLIWKTYKK
jgi:hypothetical protein